MTDNQELSSIEKDFCSFYEFCKEQNFTEQEMHQICAPLTSLVRKAKLQRALRYLFITSMFLIIVYHMIQTETVSWHASAIGRIALINMLPFWNWQPLFAEKCLVKNSINYPKNNFDCVLCEAIEEIPVVDADISPETLNELYIDVSVPVIVINDQQHEWPISKQNNYDEIAGIMLKNYILASSLPCQLSTNMLSTTTEVKIVIQQSFKFEKFFFHFQNCEIDAVKAFRVLSPRPHYLKPEILPIQYSWLLVNRNYKSPNFKPINLRESITIVAQIKGSHFIRLLPRKNCVGECPVLETELHKGESVLFTALWDFEYKPNENTTNVAVILETSF